MSAWDRRLAVLISGTILLVGCSWLAGAGPTSVVQGILYEQAVAIARNYGGVSEFVRAEAGTLGDFDGLGETALPEERRNRLVWAVFFRGIVTPSCPVTPSGVPPPNCDDLDAEMRVVFDYRTGEFLYSSVRPWP